MKFQEGDVTPWNRRAMTCIFKNQLFLVTDLYLILPLTAEEGEERYLVHFINSFATFAKFHSWFLLAPLVEKLVSVFRTVSS